MNKKQIIRLTESQFHQIVKEAVKAALKEGVGDEYLDDFGKTVSRSKRFGNVKDLSNWDEEQFDSLNDTRLDMHKKGRGKKTKGSTETCDWLRRQTEKGNPIIKYKQNPDAWLGTELGSVNESKVNKIIKESVKEIVNEIRYNGDSFHGNDSESWRKIYNIRRNDLENLEKDAKDGVVYTDSETGEVTFPEERIGKADRSLKKDYDNWNDVRDAEIEREVEMKHGWKKPVNKELVQKMVTKLLGLRKCYRPSFGYTDRQVNKTFNHGQGSLAFAQFIDSKKIILVNKLLANKKDIEIIESNFPDWKIQFVELGYPDWYNIKLLSQMV